MRKTKTTMAVRVMTRLALLGALALALGWVESFIPTPYGTKLGLANTVLLYSLYLLDVPSSFILMILKVFLSLLTPGGASRFLYSAVGALLSLLMMLLVKTVGGDKMSILGVSVVGAVFHNVGQMAVAMLFFGMLPILAYAPVMMIAGVIMGVATGIVGKYAISALKKIEQGGHG